MENYKLYAFNDNPFFTWVRHQSSFSSPVWFSNLGSGKCLAAQADLVGQPVVQKNCNTADVTQLWYSECIARSATSPMASETRKCRIRRFPSALCVYAPNMGWWQTGVAATLQECPAGSSTDDAFHWWGEAD